MDRQFRLLPVVFSAALCRSLIEAPAWTGRRGFRAGFSAALCRSLIEADHPGHLSDGPGLRFLRLYAAASLKRARGAEEADEEDRFLRLYAAASLKRTHLRPPAPLQAVFCGFMPQPH